MRLRDLVPIVVLTACVPLVVAGCVPANQPTRPYYGPTPYAQPPNGQPQNGQDGQPQNGQDGQPDGQPDEQPTPMQPGDPPRIETSVRTGRVDLAVAAPPGWRETRSPDAVRYAAHFDHGNRDYEVVVLPSQPIVGNLDAMLDAFMSQLIKDNGFKVDDRITPSKRRLQSGYVVLAAEVSAHKPELDGKVNHGGGYRFVCYLLVGSERVVPLAGYYQDPTMQADYDLEAMLVPWFETMSIPNAPPDTRSLFTAQQLVGKWRGGDAHLASYVDERGNVVGNASSFSAVFFTFEGNGSFTESWSASRDGRVAAGTRKGTYTVEDTLLVLAADGKKTAIKIWEIGRAPNGQTPTFRLAPQASPLQETMLGSPHTQLHNGYVYPQ